MQCASDAGRNISTADDFFSLPHLSPPALGEHVSHPVRASSGKSEVIMINPGPGSQSSIIWLPHRLTESSLATVLELEGHDQGLFGNRMANNR